MAHGNIGNKNGLRFGEGQTRVGSGRPKLTDLERAVRESTREQIAIVIDFFQQMNRTELNKFIKDKSNKIFELAVASAYREAIDTGDFTKIDKIFDRTLGKSKNIVEHLGSSADDIVNPDVRAFALRYNLVERGTQTKSVPQASKKKTVKKKQVKNK